MVEATRLNADAVRRYVREAGERGGVPSSQLDMFVSSFVEADLRGVETHGIARIPAYVRAFLRRIVNPAPTVSVIHDTGAAVHVDGDNGLGMVVGQIAMDQAIERSHEFGVGVVSVRNSNHSGMLATHVQRAVNAGTLGFFASGGVAIMAAFGGAEPVLGNGPFAWGIPRAGDFPIIVDMAASTAARGKIRLLAAEGKPIPEGWAVDAGGRPTTDAKSAMEGVVLPMAGHKGYGIALAVEVISSVLSGSTLAVEAPREFLRDGATVLDAWRIGHFAMALDLDAFAGSGLFMGILDRLVSSVIGSRRADGVSRILLPGQLEWERRTDRLEHGIPVSPIVLSSLDAFANEIGIHPIER
jgi:LDH2 family malate/lactate/ureidoglycolate dehydrogenase